LAPSLSSTSCGGTDGSVDMADKPSPVKNSKDLGVPCNMIALGQFLGDGVAVERAGYEVG
jgi:hypothetical protein